MRPVRFVRRDRLYAQGMNPAGNHAFKCLIYRAMADYLGFPAKLRADYHEIEMAAAGVASMTRVFGAVVLYVEQYRLEYREPAADLVSNGGHQAGSVLRKGLTSTSA